MTSPDDLERIPYTELSVADLSELYDDLERYMHVVGDLGETITGLIRQIAHARRLHQENCPVAQSMVRGNAWRCSLCDALAAPGQEAT